MAENTDLEAQITAPDDSRLAAIRERLNHLNAAFPTFTSFLAAQREFDLHSQSDMRYLFAQLDLARSIISSKQDVPENQTEKEESESE